MKHHEDAPMHRRSISAADLDQVARQRPQRKAMVAKVVGHVAAHPGCGWRDIGARWGWAQGTTLRIVRLALHEGLLEGTIDALQPARPAAARASS